MWQLPGQNPSVASCVADLFDPPLNHKQLKIEKLAMLHRGPWAISVHFDDNVPPCILNS